MIIIIKNMKKKVLWVLSVLLLIFALTLTIPIVANKNFERLPVFTDWFEDEQPTGNPMRVEETESESKFEHAMELFVIKLQDFYYE
ncbi:hypothetical protein SYNTR_0396 [Candidatus Syntrophocurvum alkaliphilum]|uniref:Uncharacterized protein n=1 Tax=Candidatus Syntrophocurvum alkaliphilum TaxID=2293317 RepID=A0A6I6DH81_9FIRM|nr:hypothetical protein [Candidatus Syntrophocurvum alkaliphilum]QGT98989.1 hypothetical protein SYNTR_0396 [Candidatus Syntrophocurvum alkaliphilum]